MITRFLIAYGTLYGLHTLIFLREVLWSRYEIKGRKEIFTSVSASLSLNGTLHECNPLIIFRKSASVPRRIRIETIDGTEYEVTSRV